jgi:ABC-type uncharacterized transport system substrate-binding protein
MFNVDAPASLLDMRAAKAAADTVGIKVATSEIRQSKDIASAFDALKGHADALYVCTDPVVFTNLVRINTLAAAVRVPTMHSRREYVEAGGLMSYGVNFTDLFRRAGDYVDKILRGAKPAEIPVEQPTKFDLVINLTTAKALGLEVPPTRLARADEVIKYCSAARLPRGRSRRGRKVFNASSEADIHAALQIGDLTRVR